MMHDWRADLESSSWIGRDLTFRATCQDSENEYVVHSRHLRHVEQRTSAEVLSLNLPLLQDALARLGRAARQGEILILD